MPLGRPISCPWVVLPQGPGSSYPMPLGRSIPGPWVVQSQGPRLSSPRLLGRPIPCLWVVLSQDPGSSYPRAMGRSIPSSHGFEPSTYLSPGWGVVWRAIQPGLSIQLHVFFGFFFEARGRYVPPAVARLARRLRTSPTGAPLASLSSLFMCHITY